MKEKDDLLFSALFHNAFKKCFGHPMVVPLSETESKLFATRLLDITGLSIGWRSLKNYSIAVLHAGTEKKENPSIATLDTLARFVLSAPYTNEIDRKNHESHHPYWFRYKESFTPAAAGKERIAAFRPALLLGTVVILVLVFLGLRHFRQQPFTENFSDLKDNALHDRGWRLLNRDEAYWKKRSEHPGMLTLFTLQGDNWPDSLARPGINNLLYTRLTPACFTAELQIENFVPMQEWQQAGLLLMEDTIPGSPSIRVSLAFNDVFGGYKRPKEILVQAISLSSPASKPEEFAHQVITYPDSGVLDNLRHTALRIVARQNQYRFLFSGSDRENGPFKEIISKPIEFTPHYIGIFALKGNKKESAVIPVIFKRFSIIPTNCN